MEANKKWKTFKDLYDTIQHFALNKNTSVNQVKLLLHQHKPEFLSLLKNLARDANDRTTIKKKGSLDISSSTIIFDEEFYDETLIISDLFELNELASAELLLAGEQQKPNYTGYSRGLVAVMLYWDGRRNLVSALRTLIQCRKGRSWSLDISDDGFSLATSFTDELLTNGITEQILKLLCNINVESDIQQLGKQKGLGDARHRRQVRDLITEVRQCLADCLFYFAGQSGLPRLDVTMIIEHLRKHSQVEADGKLSTTTLALLFAVLYAITLPTDSSNYDDRDAEELLKYPLFADKQFIPSIHKLLVQDSNPWSVPGVRACLRLVWALTLRSITQSSYISTMSPVSGDFLEQDEEALELALADRVFLFMKKNIVLSDSFHTEEFYVRHVHTIITDLLVNMALKVKEMHNHGDEVARIMMLHLVEGEEPPAELRKDFLHLMELITSLYGRDPLGLQLSAEFWCPFEQNMILEGSYVAARKIPHRQMALFKFIRQSGDVLPPLLYIPYIHMLTALSTGSRSSRAAFEMLRGNAGNGESMISWDHFFISCHRYYENLRQDAFLHPDATSSFMSSQPFTSQKPPRSCTITPHEVEGLRAVMKLVAKVAEYDNIACIAFYEDSRWSVCSILFGLLQCPIPVQLKGNILIALSHLARVPDVALGLLQACESSQLLQPAQVSGKPKGLAAELAEIESREEQYPMTQGFTKLLSALSDLPALGEGFTPYLLFSVESVFLCLMTRAYARPEEKWEVASSLLDFFNRLLTQYHPLPEHFQDNKPTIALRDVSSSPSGKLPTFSLLLHIYKEGNFFKTLMQIIDECITYLSTYITKPNLERTLVEAAERSLQLILNVLEVQDEFVSALRSSGSSLLITTLDKLLFEINPRTDKADYTVNIARFICHNASHPNLSLLAVRIISRLCFSITHYQLVTAMTSSCELVTRQKIVQGFVEVLDTPCPETSEDADQPVTSQCRLAIVRLLIHSVNSPSPNLSRLLLFDPVANASQTNLQDPGVMGSSRSCLHSVLSILNANSEQPPAITESPNLAEACYQLIYRLAFNTETSELVLRYLRSSYDFLYEHIQLLPFRMESDVSNTIMMQQSWLLKTVAIELHSLAAKQQRTNTERLVQVLFGQLQQGANTSALLGQTLNRTQMILRNESIVHSMAIMDSTIRPSAGMLKISRMLDIIQFSQTFPQHLTLDQFIPSVVEEGIKLCESTNEHGVEFCDIKMLHRLLDASLNDVEEMNRKRLAVEDIQNILLNAVERNKMRETVHAKLHFLSAWKHVLEVALTSCLEDLSPKVKQQQVLFTLLQHIIKIVGDEESVQELTSPLAAVVLTLVMQTRSCLMVPNSSERSSASMDEPHQDLIYNLASLQVILRGILDWLNQSGVNQKVRVHLYASLLHYLQLCQQTKGLDFNRSNRLVLLAAKEDVHSRLSRENLKLLRVYGDSFMDLVCKDACSGQSVCRVLAFACLDSIIQMDLEQVWLQFMVKNGYINHIANSFLQEDESLQEYLLPTSGPLRSVYIYEQKMALLCSIAHSLGGARVIIDSGVLTQLSSCSFLETRPQTEYTNRDSSAPSCLSRYRQLLFPALHLCSALLTALGGSTHHEVCALILQFLLSHITPMVSNVLRSNDYDYQALVELKLVTELLCQITGQDFADTSLYPDIPQVVLMEIQGHLQRIQRQFLSLLPHYFVSDDFLSNLKSKLKSLESFEKVNLLIHEIGSNILSYCRVVTVGTANTETTALFSPSLSESSINDSVYESEDARRPHMGILVQILRTILSRYETELERSSQLKYKLENVENLNSEELHKFLDPTTDTVKLSIPQEQKLVSSVLRRSIKTRTKLLQSLQYTLETALLLLWQHLDYYVTDAKSLGSYQENILFPSKNQRQFETNRLQDISNVTYHENKLARKQMIRAKNLEELKTQLPRHMNESFLRKLSNIEDKGSFIRPLVRRIQCIQLRFSGL